jgi:tetratricopeptide (TPR) repeat protein
LLLLLAGCAGMKTQPSAESAAAAAQAQPAPVESENKAVIALLDLAHTDNQAGRREAAGASLERALRIEPRNPWLWHELAKLRLTQGQYEQAISMARKSNSFAGQDRRLQALNWRAIGDARIAQGDSAGAEQALKQAAELEQSQ